MINQRGAEAMTKQRTISIQERIGGFARDEEGGGTVWMMFWTIAFLMLGGVAIDTAKAWRMEAMMRSAADSAAHAAVVDLASKGEDEARDTAIRFARAMMPPEQYGEVLAASDVEFGVWDKDTGRFTMSDEEPDSVRLTVRRSVVNDNPEPTTLLRLVGHNEWNLSTNAVARVVKSDLEMPPMPNCDEYGNAILSDGFVHLRSNNVFQDVCVYGETGVRIQSNNAFFGTTKVTMPNPEPYPTGMFELPASGYKTNFDLAGRVWMEDMDLSVVASSQSIDGQIAETVAYGVNNNIFSEIAVSEFDLASMLKNHIYWVSCGTSGTLSIPQNSVVEDMFVFTDCSVEFKKNVKLVNTVIGTTGDAAEDEHTMYSPSGLVVGEPDGCDPDEKGGSQLLVDGNFHAAAALTINSSQIVASGPMHLAAQALGLNGVSVIAGGDIDITSNNAFGECDLVDHMVTPPKSMWVGRAGAFALAR